MDSGQFVGTFPIDTDNLSKFRSYISSLLKGEKYQIEHSEMKGDNLVIIAAKGNKFLHYLAELILEYLPFSELLGWAVRVQLSFSIIRKTDEGHYILRVVCEPACNEINPINSYLEQDEPRDLMQSVGEDKKCQDAFQYFTNKLIKSKYLAQKS